MTNLNGVEVRVELARIDERLKAMDANIERGRVYSAEALKIASDELARRLVDLNHAHQEARAVLGTYIPRDVYERDKKEGEGRLSFLELGAANLAGKLWLPFAAIMAIISTVVSIGIKYLAP